MSVAECQERVTSAEFTEWMAYAQKTPFGPMWDDYRFGILCTLIDSMFRAKGKPRPPSYFFPSLKQDKPHRQTPEEMARALKAWTVALGGEIQ